MSFSFDATAGASQSTAKPMLKGGDIYPVTFTSCEKRDIQGVKDPEQVYKVLDFTFENEDGKYIHTIFEPKGDDFNRKETEFTNNKTGKVEKIPQASNVESMMLFFKHLIDSVAPGVAKQIDSGERSLTAADWEQLRNLVIQMLAKSSGVSIKIKLITKNNGDASFPFFASVNREGKAYVRNNFIGDKVAFTAYELDKIKAMATANPSPVSDFSAPVESGSESNLDMDFKI